jgi:hypothetical protein
MPDVFPAFSGLPPVRSARAVRLAAIFGSLRRTTNRRCSLWTSSDRRRRAGDDFRFPQEPTSAALPKARTRWRPAHPRMRPARISSDILRVTVSVNRFEERARFGHPNVASVSSRMERSKGRLESSSGSGAPMIPLALSTEPAKRWKVRDVLLILGRDHHKRIPSELEVRQVQPIGGHAVVPLSPSGDDHPAALFHEALESGL